MGLMLAEPGFHTRCFVEWEEYPRRVLIAAQRAGYFAPAPIWDDVTNFDARPFRGAIDTVLAGYPCQPFSQAGQRRGEDDPRHLWPHVARVIRECEPEWVFLENVAGHVSLGAEAVLRELWDMGWTPAAGLFSADEVGAPHKRLRWFCVGHNPSVGRGEGRAEPEFRGGRDAATCDGGRMANPDGWHPGAEREQRGGKLGFQPEGGRVVDDTSGARPAPTGGWTNKTDGQRGREQVPCDGRNVMADARQPGPQGRERPGALGERHRAVAPGPAPERGGLPLFPPGPGERDAWASILAADPARAPALARRDAKAAALRFASVVPPDEAEAILQRTRDLPREDFLSAVGGETGGMVEQAAALASLRDALDGLAHRSRALRLCGNGVVPLAAAYAWRTLSAAHGLGRVDMGAAERNRCRDADGYVLMESGA